jgi:hypothetical protein
VVNASGKRFTQRQTLVRTALKLLPGQIAHTSIYHIEGRPFALEEPAPLVMVGSVIACVSARIYVASVLISIKQRTPYDWAAATRVIVAAP